MYSSRAPYTSNILAKLSDKIILSGLFRKAKPIYIAIILPWKCNLLLFLSVVLFPIDANQLYLLIQYQRITFSIMSVQNLCFSKYRTNGKDLKPIKQLLKLRCLTNAQTQHEDDSISTINALFRKNTFRKK